MLRSDLRPQNRRLQAGIEVPQSHDIPPLVAFDPSPRSPGGVEPLQYYEIRSTRFCLTVAALCNQGQKLLRFFYFASWRLLRSIAGANRTVA
jgi:hypothetical protein